MLYCGRMSLVADLLQGLFKEAYSLQKGLLELLDRISLDGSASEEEVSDIVTGVYESLPSLRSRSCHQAFFLSHSSIFLAVVSLIYKHFFLSSSVIHSLLDMCSVISNLDIALHANTWKFLIKSVEKTLFC